jgi:outer membrane protein OmpA-like peptidoglycan-associated protein
MKRLIAIMLVSMLAAAPTLSANPNTRDKTIKGAAIGAAAGAVAGAIIHNNKKNSTAKRGAVIGGVAGGAAGAIVGAMMDRQERELRQIEGLDVYRTGEGELKVTMRNEVLFDFDSSALRSASRSELREMAGVFNRYSDTTIVVEGHTDSIGTDAYNQRLSERRASAVANFLQDQGVRGSRIDAYGYGESRPRASNGTSSGRQQNRRVEIYVRANA